MDSKVVSHPRYFPSDNHSCGLWWCKSLPPNGVSKELYIAVSQSADQQVLSKERDFESLVLRKLRQAEERKRLAEEIAKQDEEDNTWLLHCIQFQL